MIKNMTMISHELLHKFEEEFNHNPIHTIALNAVTNNGASKVAINRQKSANYRLTFSTHINTPNITNQKQSGRCWIFAALNALRIHTVQYMDVKEFEFSQSYLMFYDKLEKANYFLESIIQTMDKRTDSRIVMWLLQHCMEDGGQWSMFTSLVKKYGVVPKIAYPESISSSATGLMNTHLSEKLREYAATIRSHYQKHQSIAALRTLKIQMLSKIYRILVIHNGIPPQNFYWDYYDQKNQFHRGGQITPLAFKDKYIHTDFDHYVSLINCPTEDKSFNQHYTVGFLGNVIDGDAVSYVNVKISVMKQAVLKTLKEGIPVWFGCDVGKAISIDKGILDPETFNFESLYNVSFNMSKGQSVEFGNGSMTHAMLITGVHEQGNHIIRWKVENSWGDKKGQQGFLVMGDTWFDRHVFQVVVPRNNVDININAILKTKPTKLEPWDAMGSLAMITK